MAVVSWSPELRIEVKKYKLFGGNDSALRANCSNLTALEKKAMDGVFSTKAGESKEPKYAFWL